MTKLGLGLVVRHQTIDLASCKSEDHWKHRAKSHLRDVMATELPRIKMFYELREQDLGCTRDVAKNMGLIKNGFDLPKFVVFSSRSQLTFHLFLNHSLAHHEVNLFIACCS